MCFTPSGNLSKVRIAQHKLTIPRLASKARKEQNIVQTLESYNEQITGEQT